MQKYNVFIEGTNFKIEIENTVQKCGFFTTRFVEANDPPSAEKQAMDFVREELQEIVLNDRENPPVMYIEKLDEIKTFGDNEVPGTGFTWFKDDE
ncbi:MAG TPA: hypothetical protein EYP35_03860 [Desulfobacterales bacterium]|nr:hypothetical protein [Desulfobacterales bacterium]